jgi:Holliday junction resolvase RusA-like endonuclease
MSDDPVVTVMLPGAPRGKGRPRFKIIKPKGRPQFVSVYTDADTAEYEASLAAVGREAMGSMAPLDEALTVFIEVFVPIPASWSKKAQEAARRGDVMPESKPDGDNYQKIAGDALNKIVWVDDSSIVMWQCLKRYSDFPRMRISVWRWFDQPAEQEQGGLFDE